MDNICEDLGIPKKYIKSTVDETRFSVLVEKLWLKSLMKYGKLNEFPNRKCLDIWPQNDEEVGPHWTKIFIKIYPKRDLKVIPLPRIRGSIRNEPPLLFLQLIQYIHQINFKNLWKEAYKKYTSTGNCNKETLVTLDDYNEVLREIIARIYGCRIINLTDLNVDFEISKKFEPPSNILPVICALESLNSIFLLHYPYVEHNLRDCVTFSPAIFEKCYSKPLFIVYQLLQTLKNLHDNSLTLGDITLNDIYITEDMWIYIFPAISSNIYVQKLPKLEAKLPQDCRKSGHKFDLSTSKCEYCGLKTYDKVQITDENLEKLCQLWVEGQISNFTYLTALNRLSGRKLGDPNCHYVFPWVTDFTSYCGKNWRDLKKSKYRLNKGDRQLDLTFENSQYAHHVSDILSSITYYVYMARRTPKSVLCKNVRTIWVPAEYPSSIHRLYEWTPDECIPEFFTDPSVFRSIHDDLDDLDVPNWCTGPEDFIEKHREALESQHVSERLHFWIDLTFGYKLAGNAAIKAKNVCLNLIDEHLKLTKSGIVQLFNYPHPPKHTTSIFCGKSFPKIYFNKPLKPKSRERSSSPCISTNENRSEDENDENNPVNRSTLSRFLSRSRSSLNEDEKKKSSSNQRSASLGPKNPSFTSHVVPKTTKLNTGLIYLPKEYKPDQALDIMEKKHQFFSKIFHPEHKFDLDNDQLFNNDSKDEENIQNSFTNLIFTENFHKQFNFSSEKFHFNCRSRNKNEIICNYTEIISARRVRELQVLGCLIVEIFMSKQLRALGANSSVNFQERLKFCLTIVKSCQHEIPPPIVYVVNLLLQPNNCLKDFKYPAVSDLGLPPPSAHLLLEPLVGCIIPFSKHFPNLFELCAILNDFKLAALDLDLLYHFDCDGTACGEYENLERTKILFAQNIGECKVKTCAKKLEFLLENFNTMTNQEIINILLPYIKDLIEDPATSVLAAWYLFDPFSRVLGPTNTQMYLLESIVKLYENEPNENTLPFYGKIAKLYHHSFLLRLIVRLGLKCFLDNFTTPLVEAVGRYKDYEKVDFLPHTHSENIFKKTSHLKTMDCESNEVTSDNSSFLSKNVINKIPYKHSFPEPEVFEFEQENEQDQLKSLIEHLELNVASDLPVNYSNPEEAIDIGNLNPDIIKNLDEFDDVLNDSGDRKSDDNNVILESPSERKRSFSTRSLKKQDAKISEMSEHSLVWLSHRLGPVLTARYLSRNLLKMLTLCYVGKENLIMISPLKDEKSEGEFSVMNCFVQGDHNAVKVLDCLCSIAGLYGEQLILYQYIPHMSELIALCKRKLTPNLEGGLISCLALLKYIIPYLSDATLMDQLQDGILKSILLPTIRLLGSIRCSFPNSSTARNILARKFIDTFYILSVRIGSDMTRTHLAVTALQRFFLIFDKIKTKLEVLLKQPDSFDDEIYESDCLSPSSNHSPDYLKTSFNELKEVFTPDLACTVYAIFLKHIGKESLDIALKNHSTIRDLCRDFKLDIKSNLQIKNESNLSTSIGSNVSVIGNRIDIQGDNDLDLLTLVSNRIENNSRHLRGNWLAYWEHEIGRSDKDIMFNFKQIKLQTFMGHTSAVKCLHVLDNENSFISGSRDKTVKLWSLRSQGDGSSISNCQWTYSAHKKSILSIAFIDCMRLVASCDSVVHIWDPFMGVNVAQLDNQRFIPVNTIKCMPPPSCLVFAATTEGTVKIIDIRSCSYIYELKISLHPTGLIRCLAVCPSGQWIATGQSSGQITILDTRTGLILSTWRGHEGEVLQMVALNNDTLISSSLDQTISVWNINDGKFKFSMRGSNEPVHCLNLYNEELISATTANRIGVHTAINLDASFSNTKLRSDAFRGLLTSMALLPLNRLLLLGADTGNINLLC